MKMGRKSEEDLEGANNCVGEQKAIIFFERLNLSNFCSPTQVFDVL